MSDYRERVEAAIEEALEPHKGTYTEAQLQAIRSFCDWNFDFYTEGSPTQAKWFTESMMNLIENFQDAS